MIRVIIGYKIQKGANIEPTLQKLRSHAMTYPGYIDSENLQNAQDPCIVAMIQTWDRVEDWKYWESSTIRQSILKEARPLAVEDARVTVYKVIPTRGWGNVSRSS